MTESETLVSAEQNSVLPEGKKNKIYPQKIDEMRFPNPNDDTFDYRFDWTLKNRSFVTGCKSISTSIDELGKRQIILR